jgi:hypothetical protein
MRWLFDDWRLCFFLAAFIAKVLESLVKRNYAPMILTLGKFPVPEELPEGIVGDPDSGEFDKEFDAGTFSDQGLIGEGVVEPLLFQAQREGLGHTSCGINLHRHTGSGEESGRAREARLIRCVKGTQFYANESEEREKGQTFFEQHTVRVFRPMTNGKVEQFFRTAKEKLSEFKSIDELVEWYNEKRFHTSLNMDIIETPSGLHQEIPKRECRR